MVQTLSRGLTDLRLLALLLAVAGAITWFPTWDEPYAEDDHLFLEAVSRPDTPAPLSWFGREGVMDHHYRPLADPLFFSALHAVSGLHPAGYHAALFLCHLGAALCLVMLGRALGVVPQAAAVAGLLYVTRDFSFPSMVWGSGFSDVGSALFAFASLAAFARSFDEHRRRNRTLALVLFALAVLTKETAIVTLGLHALVVIVRSRARPHLAAVRSLVPFILVGLPLALVQVSIARFEEGYGQRLYRLSFGSHAFTVWPAYLVWCVAAVRELLSRNAIHVPLSVACYAAALGAAIASFHGRIGARRRRRGDAPLASPGRTPPGPATPARDRMPGWLAAAWFVIALVPALLAPGRVLTNYLAIAAGGPCLWLGSVLLAGARSNGRLAGRTALALIGITLVLGPVLVLLKDSGTLAGGGWVNLARSREMDRILDELPLALPDPPPRSRILVLGGLDVDLRVLGDPRGSGFGEQQVLASAIRSRYGRFDLEVLSLPSAERAPAPVLLQAVALISDNRAPAVVVTASTPVRDVTDRLRRVVQRGGDADELRRALLGP